MEENHTEMKVEISADTGLDHVKGIRFLLDPLQNSP